MADTVIHRGEAFEAEWNVQRRDALTGTPAPIGEDSAVAWWLSATYKGDPILPATVVPLTRRELELRDDARVLWFGILAGQGVSDTLSGILTGSTVYEVCEIDGERKSGPLVVAD